MRYANILFRAFQRLNAADGFSGIGIGLATVSRIIYRHGGRIRAEGVVNRGATFCFTLGDPRIHLP
jgi:light-regulated signal transduction histidine kinase (bacteriophytochrome)